MKKIIIKNQEEFDKISKIEKDEEIIFESNKIEINCVLEVFGILKLKGEIKSSWNNKYIRNYGECHIESRESSQNHIVSRESSQNHIVSWESSQNHIVSRESSQNHIVSRESSQNHIVSWESSQNHIVSRESSQNHIVSWESSQNHIESRESSQNHIESRESSQNHIVSWESSQNHIESRESSQNHIESRESSQNHIENFCKTLCVYGFSIASIPFKLKIKIKKSKTAIIQRYKPITDYFEKEGIIKKNGKVILFKRVSVDFKTQEKEKNETLWNIGSIVTHAAWNPTEQECGDGKFHACSRPYFCDEFRNKKDDKYIAIEVLIKDTYEWKSPTYTHKIAFRKCKVLYVCDKYGKEIKQ